MTDDLFDVLDLPPDQFRQAYPLIQLLKTDLTLEQWLEYANDLHCQPSDLGGVLSVQSAAKYIYGLAAYKVRSRDANAQVLEVEHLCVLDLLNRSVGRLMIEALEQRGNCERCFEIQVRAPGTIGMMRWLRHQMPGAFLRDLGYVVDDNLLSKRLQ